MDITSGIKNIIFDWGGVIIDINYNFTRDAFINLGLTHFDNHYSQFEQMELFDKLDVGQISQEDFFQGIQKEMPEGAGTEEIRDAWNAMLGDFPEENYQLLTELKDEYRTFLFSNTNEPHLDFYFKKLHELFGISAMDPLFEKAYYSCRFGWRKPNPESYTRILDENGLIASETLFIDDSPQNIDGADKVGMKTYFFRKDDRLKDLFV